MGGQSGRRASEWLRKVSADKLEERSIYREGGERGEKEGLRAREIEGKERRMKRIGKEARERERD